jgi:hypothetical protein
MRQVFFIFFFACSFFTLRANSRQTYTQQENRDSIPLKSDTILPKKDSAQLKSVPDSTLEKEDSKYVGKEMSQAARDSIAKKRRDNPRRATIYSAILPGAGQVYNRKYWKVPLVYAAIGIPAYLFFYNKSWYQKCQYALVVTINGSTGDSLTKVAPELQPFVRTDDQAGIITYRDSFRKDQDYSVLFFMLFYALNIVDATVDAHLKDFNVNSDLSFQLKPMILPGPTPSAGVTVAFNFHKPRPRALFMN